MKTKIYAEESKRLVLAHGYNWKDVDDVKTVYSPVFGVPQGSEYSNDDADFRRQRLASLNSSLINLFGVSEEMVKPFLEGKTLVQAMDEKRLFIIDLAILEGCPANTEDLVIMCPFALFYFNNANHLMPIAIQLFQQKGPDNPVFLRSDPLYTWMLAKMWYSLADATYHQAVEGSMKADYEIQNWGAEIVKSRDDGGVGILCPVVIETILQSIANRAELLGVMSITKVISEKVTQSLGDFEKELIVDPSAVHIVGKFRQSLREIGKKIDERNKRREHPYEWLHPSAIPNYIRI